MHKWQLHEAKNKLSSLIDTAIDGKAQIITRRGEDAAIIIGIKEYKKLKGQKSNLKKFLLNSPKIDNFEVTRGAAKYREIDL
jgi:antitoxin Phd